MRLSVMAVSWTVPDWRVIQTLTQAALGRSVTKSLDDAGVLDRNLAAFIAVLGEFQAEGSRYSEILRSPGALLRHAMVSVLVAGDRDTFYQLALDGDLSILDCDGSSELVICSANLESWRSSVINYCSLNGTDRQRAFYSLMLSQFDKFGLSKLFEGYSRSLVDGQYLLTEKR